MFGGRHRHDWAQWEVTGVGEIREGNPPLVVMFTGRQEWRTVGEVRRQERRCKACGLSEVKSEKVYY